MPVGAVTRSQTVQGLSNLPTRSGEAFFFEFPGASKWNPEKGEFIASVQGTFNPEPKGVVYGGSLSYTFIPSHLRTRYSISYFTVVIPTVTFAIPTTEVGEGEFEFELGFLTLVRISGLPYFSSPVSTENIILKATELEGNSFTLSKKTQQISLVETITAVPGASIELELIPFIKVVRVIKPAKLVGIVVGANLSLPETITSGGRVTSSSVMVYEQQYEKKG